MRDPAAKRQTNSSHFSRGCVTFGLNLWATQNNRAQSEMRLKSHFPGSSGYCEILSGIPARGALWRCENSLRPGAPWTTCLQPTRRMTQQQAATLCPKTDAHPIGRLPERSPECQSFNLVLACVSPANSCISRLLRLHIACDLMADAGQQLCGKEGGGCVVSSSRGSILAGGRGCFPQSGSKEGSDSYES